MGLGSIRHAQLVILMTFMLFFKLKLRWILINIIYELGAIGHIQIIIIITK